MAEFEVAELPLDNDWQVWYTLRKRSQTTGRYEADDSLSVTAFLSETADQAAVALHGTLSITLTARGGGSGDYYGTITGANLTTQLAATYIGKVLYEIVKDGQRVRTARPLRVVATRTPATR